MVTHRAGVDMRVIAEYARQHHGLITLDAARRRGAISRAGWYRAVADGRLELLHPGVPVPLSRRGGL